VGELLKNKERELGFILISERPLEIEVIKERNIINEQQISYSTLNAISKSKISLNDFQLVLRYSLFLNFEKELKINQMKLSEPAKFKGEYEVTLHVGDKILVIYTIFCQAQKSLIKSVACYLSLKSMFPTLLNEILKKEMLAELGESQETIVYERFVNNSVRFTTKNNSAYQSMGVFLTHIRVREEHLSQLKIDNQTCKHITELITENIKKEAPQQVANIVHLKAHGQLKVGGLGSALSFSVSKEDGLKPRSVLIKCGGKIIMEAFGTFSNKSTANILAGLAFLEIFSFSIFKIFVRIRRLSKSKLFELSQDGECESSNDISDEDKEDFRDLILNLGEKGKDMPIISENLYTKEKFSKLNVLDKSNVYPMTKASHKSPINPYIDNIPGHAYQVETSAKLPPKNPCASAIISDKNPDSDFLITGEDIENLLLPRKLQDDFTRDMVFNLNHSSKPHFGNSLSMPSRVINRDDLSFSSISMIKEFPVQKRDIEIGKDARRIPCDVFQDEGIARDRNEDGFGNNNSFLNESNPFNRGAFNNQSDYYSDSDDKDTDEIFNPFDVKIHEPLADSSIVLPWNPNVTNIFDKSRSTSVPQNNQLLFSKKEDNYGRMNELKELKKSKEEDIKKISRKYPIVDREDYIEEDSKESYEFDQSLLKNFQDCRDTAPRLPKIERNSPNISRHLDNREEDKKVSIIRPAVMDSYSDQSKEEIEMNSTVDSEAKNILKLLNQRLWKDYSFKLVKGPEDPHGAKRELCLSYENIDNYKLVIPDIEIESFQTQINEILFQVFGITIDYFPECIASELYSVSVIVTSVKRNFHSILYTQVRSKTLLGCVFSILDCVEYLIPSFTSILFKKRSSSFHISQLSISQIPVIAHSYFSASELSVQLPSSQLPVSLPCASLVTRLTPSQIASEFSTLSDYLLEMFSSVTFTKNLGQLKRSAARVVSFIGDYKVAQMVRRGSAEELCRETISQACNPHTYTVWPTTPHNNYSRIGQWGVWLAWEGKKGKQEGGVWGEGGLWKTKGRRGESGSREIASILMMRLLTGQKVLQIICDALKE